MKKITANKISNVGGKEGNSSELTRELQEWPESFLSTTEAYDVLESSLAATVVSCVKSESFLATLSEISGTGLVPFCGVEKSAILTIVVSMESVEQVGRKFEFRALDNSTALKLAENDTGLTGVTGGVGGADVIMRVIVVCNFTTFF